MNKKVEEGLNEIVKEGVIINNLTKITSIIEREKICNILKTNMEDSCAGIIDNPYAKIKYVICVHGEKYNFYQCEKIKAFLNYKDLRYIKVLDGNEKIYGDDFDLLITENNQIILAICVNNTLYIQSSVSVDKDDSFRKQLVELYDKIILSHKLIENEPKPIGFQNPDKPINKFIENNNEPTIIKNSNEQTIKSLDDVIDECEDIVIRTLEADAVNNVNINAYKLARRKTHVMTVAKLCRYMTREINKKIDKENKKLDIKTMFLAGLLHDLCKFECNDMHDIISAVRSKDILTGYGYPEIGTELCFIIKEHSNKVKQKNVNLKQQILKEADILSHLALTYFEPITDIDKKIDEIDKIIDEVSKLKVVMRTNIGLKMYKKMMRNLKQYSRELVEYQLYNK